jgi:hypothetical protein
MDVEGPGAVVRFWATWHGPHGEQGLKEFSNGTLRFYLDNDPQPAIEGPIASILDGGGLCRGPLAQGVSPQTQYGQRGHNLYLPSPTQAALQDHVRNRRAGRSGRTPGRGAVLSDQLPDLRRRHFGRTFLDAADRGSPGQAGRGPGSIAALRSGKPGRCGLGRLAGPSGRRPDAYQVIDQPGAVRQLTIQLAADNLPQALRSTVLEICFDGQRTVWCPVGDFFGRSYLSDPHRTWYTEVTEDGRMSCFGSCRTSGSARSV